MPERLQLTGGPEEAAAQLIADLEQRGILQLMDSLPDESREWKILAEENFEMLKMRLPSVRN